LINAINAVPYGAAAKIGLQFKRRFAMVLTGATASAAGTQSSDGSFMSPRRFRQRDGEVVYRTVCQDCHMAEAQGAVGAGTYPALANDPKLAAADTQ
jgi:mono/diheme cytochrome c family protein